MNKWIKLIFFLEVIFFLLPGWALAEEKNKTSTPSLTHADAAVILTKYSGFFDRYVKEDADLTQCVAFLNRTGVYFGLLEVVNGTVFTPRDAARALGQIDLALKGEAEFSSGKIKLPSGIESWESYCVMNRVEYRVIHQTMREMLRVAYEQKE